MARWTDPVLDSFTNRAGDPAAVTFPDSEQAPAGVPAGDQTVWTIGDQPASPGSPGQLFLSALLAAGCFQLARHRHDLKLAALPQWYHEYAPLQIRHVVRYDFHPSIPGVRRFEQVRNQDPGTREIVRELHRCCQPVALRPALTLRGPPLS